MRRWNSASLAIEIRCHEPLAQQCYARHLRLDAASAVVSTPSPSQSRVKAFRDPQRLVSCTRAGDGRMAFARIIGPVGGDAPDLLIRPHLAERVGQRWRIADVAVRDLDGTNLRRFCVSAEMDPGPDPASGVTRIHHRQRALKNRHRGEMGQSKRTFRATRIRRRVRDARPPVTRGQACRGAGAIPARRTLVPPTGDAASRTGKGHQASDFHHIFYRSNPPAARESRFLKRRKTERLRLMIHYIPSGLGKGATVWKYRRIRNRSNG
ncbi:hypothetical protein SAMN05421539_10337 [Jannaschia seohaensis]|uniref:Uncharacterized protein n=1 Tax=Jannaschia seohaensis TaxID=475081 RepID=A0A2Y9ALL9_9RHOB|nr:hypothetical protein BCF38_10337 [Jannaschia seohaensis]SSA44218.1 hypothetical protein SAMN05421539_10337 [Jannaschia seohaensis]